MEIPRTLYWNCLMTSPPAERFAYLDAVLDGYTPDLVGIAEFREADLTSKFAADMQQRGFAIDFEPAIKADGEWEGLLVLSLGKTAIERMSPWPEYKKLSRYGERIDNRQAVRCERDGFAVYFGHITHPHEHMDLSRRRTKEWLLSGISWQKSRCLTPC